MQFFKISRMVHMFIKGFFGKSRISKLLVHQFQHHFLKLNERDLSFD